MSASPRVRFGLVAAAMTCWLLGSAVAAEVDPKTGQPIQPLYQGSAAKPASQIDRNQQPGLQPAQRPLQRQRYEAGYRGTQADNAQPGRQQLGQEVDNYLANCLLKHNKMEIELAQFAEQQSQNSEVKQFASQLAKDHRQIVQKLEPIAAAHAAGGVLGSPTLDKNAATGNDHTTLGATGGAAATPGSSGTNTVTPPGTTSTAATDLDRSTTAALASAGAAGATHNGNAALGQLAAIEEKINERCAQAFREELSQKSGAEFDECFVGAQIGGHMHMLAALEVISQDSQGPLKQVADDARPIVQKHLDEAKQWMKQAKSGERTSAQAQRTSTSAETQR